MTKRPLVLSAALAAALLPAATAAASDAGGVKGVKITPQLDGQVKDFKLVILGIPIAL